MVFSKSDGVWYRLSHCGFIWRVTPHDDLDIKIKIANNEVKSEDVFGLADSGSKS